MAVNRTKCINVNSMQPKTTLCKQGYWLLLKPLPSEMIDIGLIADKYELTSNFMPELVLILVGG